MKKLFALFIMLLLLTGCSMTHLKWGDAEYTAWGETSLRDVEVICTPDGGVSIKAASALTEDKALRELIQALREVAERMQ